MVRIGTKTVGESVVRRSYFLLKRYVILNKKIFLLEWSNAQECVTCRETLRGWLTEAPFKRGEIIFLNNTELNNILGKEVALDDR